MSWPARIAFSIAGQDRVLVADDARQDVGARREALEQVGAQLLLDRPRAPAAGRAARRWWWGGGRRTWEPQVAVGTAGMIDS